MDIDKAISILEDSNRLLKGRMDELRHMLKKSALPKDATDPYSVLERCEAEYEAVEMAIQALRSEGRPEGKDPRSAQPEAHRFGYVQARADIIEYLSAQPEDYFTQRGRSKREVLRDTETIADLTCEHLHCVKRFGNDREWSCKDACDIAPGICKNDDKGDRP